MTTSNMSLPTPTGDIFEWDPDSTYVRKPPYFDGMTIEPAPVTDVEGARVLAKLGDSVTTDHISPAGSIRPDSPAGRYLIEHGVDRRLLPRAQRAARRPCGQGSAAPSGGVGDRRRQGRRRLGIGADGIEVP